MLKYTYTYIYLYVYWLDKATTAHTWPNEERFPNNSSFAYYFPLNWLCNELNISVEVTMSQWANDSCVYLCICWHNAQIRHLHRLLANAVVVVVVFLFSLLLFPSPPIDWLICSWFFFVVRVLGLVVTTFTKWKLNHERLVLVIIWKTSCCNLSALNQLVGNSMRVKLKIQSRGNRIEMHPTIIRGKQHVIY